ncbi:MAG: RNA-binding S4 domain-containing protein, partial [Synergistes sp.]|nr:RNA-binding S4 domain-containing protein [Synergistes sp.]
MRLDKFLKLSRLVKRRTVAQEMAEIGAVRVNGRQCKPSSEVREGDTIEVAYPRKLVTVKALT